MKESLSEQICKICDISFDCCKYAKYGYEGEQEPWYFCTKNNEECWTYPRKDLTGCKDFVLGYYDFETVNFVKLFNLKYTEHDDDTIANFIFLRYKNIINTRTFLGYLLFELEHSSNSEVGKIKTAIKNQSWDI